MSSFSLSKIHDHFYPSLSTTSSPPSVRAPKECLRRSQATNARVRRRMGTKASSYSVYSFWFATGGKCPRPKTAEEAVQDGVKQDDQPRWYGRGGAGGFVFFPIFLCVLYSFFLLLFYILHFLCVLYSVFFFGNGGGESFTLIPDPVNALCILIIAAFYIQRCDQMW